MMAGTMTTCRACKRENLYLFLPLGMHPPANAFVRPGETAGERSFPLDTYACLNCGLVEVPDQIPPDFFRNYLYVPSASEAMHAHFAELARTLKGRCLLKPDDLAVDIGCNDGLLLNSLKGLGVRTLGIDPAANLVALARAKGLEVVNEYFTPQTARALRERYGPAAVIVTTNTFNHIDDLHAFVAAVTVLLGPDGTFVIEVPQALEYVRGLEFDTVYHEHLSTFSVKSLVELAKFFGLVVTDVEPLPIHGGSMRVFLRQAGAGADAVARDWVTREQQAGLFDRTTYDRFAVEVRTSRDKTMSLLRRLKGDGNRLVGYGAPAKGNTLLNYYGIGPDLLDYLADRNSLKHELLSPGMHIPICAAERILAEQPDYVFILAWNFADEIVRQQDEYRRRGGQFILPIPELRVIR